MQSVHVCALHLQDRISLLRLGEQVQNGCHMLAHAKMIKMNIYIYMYLAYVHGYHEETVSLVTFLYNLTGCGICIIDCDLRWFVIPKSSLASMPFPPWHLSMQGTH